MLWADCDRGSRAEGCVQCISNYEFFKYNPLSRKGLKLDGIVRRCLWNSLMKHNVHMISFIFFEAYEPFPSIHTIVPSVLFPAFISSQAARNCRKMQSPLI